MSFKGVLYLKHLLRGVKLGLFDDAASMVKFQQWHEEHEAKSKQRSDDHRKGLKTRNTYVPPVREEKVEDASNEAEATSENSEG